MGIIGHFKGMAAICEGAYKPLVGGGGLFLTHHPAVLAGIIFNRGLIFDMPPTLQLLPKRNRIVLQAGTI